MSCNEVLVYFFLKYGRPIYIDFSLDITYFEFKALTTLFKGVK